MEGDNIKKEGEVGPVIGVIIILLVIILGGFYFWGTRESNDANLYGELDSTATSTSDDTTSIEADLEATDIDSLDADL